jgi:hypothetical protein
MSKIKEQIDAARQNTRVAFLGGALVVAGAWGSCQFELGEQGQEVGAEVEQAPEPPAEEPPAEEPKDAVQKEG